MSDRLIFYGESYTVITECEKQSWIIIMNGRALSEVSSWWKTWGAASVIEKSIKRQSSMTHALAEGIIYIDRVMQVM